MGAVAEADAFHWPRARDRIELRTASFAAGIFAVAGGCAVLLGWALDIPLLKSVRSGLPNMVPYTAVAFAFCGLALVLLDAPQPTSRRLGQACAAIVGLFAVTVLIAYATGSPLGFEHLLFSGARSAELSPPGQPAPTTALSFLLTAAALATLHLQLDRAARAAELLAFSVLLLALLVLAGYVYGAESYFAAGAHLPYTGTALHTALLFFVLALGILFAHPDTGLMSVLTSSGLAGAVARRFLLLVVAFPVLGVAVMLGQRVGLYDQPVASVLLAILTVAVAVPLVLVTGRSLERVEDQRRRHEADLRRWQRFFEEARWGALFLDRDGAILLANRAFARLVEVRAARLAGRSVLEVLGAHRPSMLDEQLRTAAARGATRFEWSLPTAEHGERVLLVDATAIGGPSGELLYYALHVEDVTERKRSEEAVARLASLIESTGDAVFATTLDGVIVSWNPAAERIYGWTAAEMLGRSDAHTLLVPADRREETIRIVATLLEGRTVDGVRTVRLRRDGTTVPVCITASPIVDQSGRRLGMSVIARDETERRASEDALQRSEASFRELVERANDPIFLADHDTRITGANAAACRLLGYERDALVGKTGADLVEPDELPRLTQLRELLSAGGSQIAEFAVRAKDGRSLTVELSGNVLPDDRWLAIVRDVTERKHLEAAQRALHEQERLLRARVESVSHASLLVSEAVAGVPESDMRAVLSAILLQARSLTQAEYGALGVDAGPDRPFDPWVHVGFPESELARMPRHPRAIGVLGLPAEPGAPATLRLSDLREHPAFRGFPPAHPTMRSFLGCAIRFRGRRVGLLYLANKRGAGEFTEEDERVIGMLAERAGSAIEIARLYEAEARDRAWLRTVLDHMPEPVLVTDACGRLVSFNPAAEALLHERAGEPDPFGNTRQLDLVGPDGEPVPWEDRPLTVAVRHREARSGIEVLVRRTDGTLVPMLMSASPVRGARGQSEGAVVVLEEISALKELERLRLEWTSVVAHDLRQPLNVIALTADGLRRQAVLADPVRRSLDRIRAASDRLRRMIDDLLEVSQLETHQLRLDRERIDAGALVRDVVERLRPITGPCGVRVSDTNGASPVNVDPGRIEQVLGNLFTNAVKYGLPDAPIDLEVRVLPHAVEIAVRNQGRGILPAELGAVFERFSRTSATRRSGIPGLGLGLYIARGIVEAHGGSLRAESIPGVATTFTVSLPRAEPA